MSKQSSIKRIWSVGMVSAMVVGLVSVEMVHAKKPKPPKKPKVEVCHVTPNGKVKLLNVNENSFQAHINHGDFEPLAFFADTDGDGFGDPAISKNRCKAPDGYVDNPDDCDDANAGVNPDAPEIEGNGIDDDCNPLTLDVPPVVCPCAMEGNALQLNALFEAQAFTQGPETTVCDDEVFPNFSSIDIVRQDGPVSTPALFLQTNDFFTFPFCVYSVLDSAGNALVDIFDQGLSDEEYAACQADIRVLLDQLVDCQ